MAKAKRVTYFVANLENKPGALLKILQDLKSQNIGLVGCWGYGTPDGQGKVYVVAKNPDKLRNAWKGTGTLVEEGTGFLFSGVDKTGALLKPLEAVAAAGINITMLDAIAAGGRFGSFIWVDASQIENTAKALGCK
jgi:prephenate dehydratase